MNRRLVNSLTLILTILMAGQVAAFSFSSGREGSGKMETRQLNLDEFRALDVGGAFDVEVRFGKTQKVEVTVDDNLWDRFEAKVKGEWLNLDWGRSCSPSDGCHVLIVIPTLEQVTISGACDMNIRDFDDHRFVYRLSGAGELIMNGRVEKLELHISGAGDADTTDLIAENVRVDISGAGNAMIYAKDSIRARISGVGNLTYFGNPEHTDTSVSGLGSIHRK